MDNEQIKLLTWKVSGMNIKIQSMTKELDDLVIERDVAENDLEKLTNLGYNTQTNEKSN